MFAQYIMTVFLIAIALLRSVPTFFFKASAIREIIPAKVRISGTLMAYNRLFVLGILLAFLFETEISYSQSADLDSLRSIYESACKKIADEAAKARENSQKQYLDLLKKHEAEFKRQGKLELTLALREEIRKFEEEKSVPDSDTTVDPPEIVALRAKFRSTFKDINEHERNEFLRVSKSYISQLESLKISLTKQDRLDEALKVNAEIDFLVSSSRYREASEAASQKQSPALQQKTKSQQPYKTISLNEIIEISGGLIDGWTYLPVNLIPGDIVSIKASGSWRLPRTHDLPPCGPGGYPDRPFFGPLLQAPGIPYGALIMRIGSSGQIMQVGESLVFTNSIPGILALDANLISRRDLRMRSSGKMNVSIEVKRPISK